MSNTEFQGVKKIAIVGEPSTGKSFSLRNLDPKTTIIITPNMNPLGFKGSSTLFRMYDAKKPNEFWNRIFCESLVDEKDRTGKIISYGLRTWLDTIKNKKPEVKTIVIEDITHFFQIRLNSDGFTSSVDRTKWGTFAQDVFKGFINDGHYNSGVEVIHIWHSKLVNINGRDSYQMLTFGQASRANILPASWYTYVFFTHLLDEDEEPNRSDRYKLVTNNTGPYVEAKTPYDCFDEDFIPNDARAALDRIHTFETEI